MLDAAKTLDERVRGTASEYEKDAAVFKALCDVRRLAVLEQLRSGEKCACVLLEKLEIGQPCLSYHMKILCESGLVTPRQAGKWTHYRLSESGRDAAAALLLRLTTPNTQAAGSGPGDAAAAAGRCGCGGAHTPESCAGGKNTSAAAPAAPENTAPQSER